LSEKYLYHDDIISYKSNKRVVLWGDGYQSRWIKNSTTFGKSNKIRGIVSDINGFNNLNLNVGFTVSPAAIQQLPDIFKEIKKEKDVYNKLKFHIFL